MDFYFKLFGIIYLPFIFTLKYIVDRQSIETKAFLCNNTQTLYSIWNMSLSIFSFHGAFFTLQYLKDNEYDCSFVDDKIVFWIRVFCISKIPELLDTVFIVLRSKKLVLLQWYHHFATLLLCWCGIHLMPKQILIAAGLNYSIHWIMYFYLFLDSLGLKEIRKYGLFITFLQTSQMFIGIYVYLTQKMSPCLIDETISEQFLYCFGFIVYLSYAVLFSLLLIEKKNR